MALFLPRVIRVTNAVQLCHFCLKLVQINTQSDTSENPPAQGSSFITKETENFLFRSPRAVNRYSLSRMSRGPDPGNILTSLLMRAEKGQELEVNGFANKYQNNIHTLFYTH